MPPTKINGYQILNESITGAQIAEGTITLDKLSVSGFPAAYLQTTGASVLISTALPPMTGQVLTATSPTTANWQTPSGGGGGTPGSPNGSIQFNNNGVFGGSSGLITDGLGNLTVGGVVDTAVSFLVNGINVLDTISVSLAGDVITADGFVVYS